MTDEHQTEHDSYTPEEPNSPEPTSQPEWWIDKETPGVGNRPEWLPEKFKSLEDVTNSYQQLEKRLGSAPKEYNLSKGESWLDPDIEGVNDFIEFARSKNVSQEIMDNFLEGVGNYLSGFKVDYKQEKERLGPDAEERLERLDNWAQANLSEDAYTALTTHLNKAEGIKALEEIREKMLQSNNSVPNGNEGGAHSGASLEDLQAELDANLDKYKTDPKYRRDLMHRMEMASKDGPFADKSY